MKVLVAGDVRGHVDALYERVAKVQSKHGAFDALLCVGAFFAPAHAGAGAARELEAYVQGRKDPPVPTYVLGASADDARVLAGIKDGGPLGKDLAFLGQRGVARIGNVSVAYLSGQYSPFKYHNHLAGSTSARFEHHYTPDDLEALARDAAGVDILLTVEWPRDVVDERGPPGNLPPGKNMDLVGSNAVAGLVRAIHPRYHFAGREGVFYERLPFAAAADASEEHKRHCCRFLGLGAVGNPHKHRWLYALNIQPAAEVDPAQLLPDGATASPFAGKTIRLEEQPGGEAGAGEAGAEPAGNGGAGAGAGGEVAKPAGDAEREREREREAAQPPPKRHRFQHLEAEQQQAQQNMAVGRWGHVPLPRPERQPRPQQNNKRPRQDPRDQFCWFCMSNPMFEDHMVVAVGDEVYLAIAKGTLVPDHALIIPVAHIASSPQLPMSTRGEMMRFREALRKYYASKGQDLICFERFMETRSGNPHMHIQAIPVPRNLSKGALDVVRETCGAAGCEMEVMAPAATLDQKIADGMSPFFLYFELPGGERLFHRSVPGERLSVHLARQAVANLLGLPERGVWKSCEESKQVEAEQAQGMKAGFAKFDPSA